jgi:hypothetical protein
MRVLSILLILLAAATSALAAEPSGCDKFAWNIADAQRLLILSRPAGAGPNDRGAASAITVSLAPLANAKLKLPPERTSSNPSSFAGLVEFAGAAHKATYAVTLSASAWIDVIQDGKYLRPIAYTGALECPGVRKSVRFAIGPAPFTLQVSGVNADTINLVVTPAD